MNEKEKKYYDNFVRAVLSLQNEEEVKEEEAKPLTKKERQRLYHQKVSECGENEW